MPLKISNKVNNLLIAITLLSFVVVSFSALMGFGMLMNTDGSMGRCPFNLDGSICVMNFQEHLNFWRVMFAALPQKTASISLMIQAIFLSIAALTLKHKIIKSSQLLFSNDLFYTKQHNYFSLIDPVTQALYQGLITPKIF